MFKFSLPKCLTKLLLGGALLLGATNAALAAGNNTCTTEEKGLPSIPAICQNGATPTLIYKTSWDIEVYCGKDGDIIQPKNLQQTLKIYGNVRCIVEKGSQTMIHYKPAAL